MRLAARTMRMIGTSQLKIVFARCVSIAPAIRCEGLDRRTVLVHAPRSHDRTWARAVPKRQKSIEPVYGHTKHNLKFDRFQQRGRLAVRTEWRLMMMSHNLTKLRRHQTAAVGA